MLFVQTTLGPSAIAGIGLFSTQFIRKGTPVWKMTRGLDLEIEPEQLERLPEPARAQVLHYAYESKRNGCYILCSDDARFFNHADDANCLDAMDPDDIEGMTVAARDIHPGEELTCDYRAFDGDAVEKLGPA